MVRQKRRSRSASLLDVAPVCGRLAARWEGVTRNLEDIPMELHMRSAPVAMRAGRFMACAQCGEPIYVAAWSEHVDDRRVRHLWEC
jgi:hypothetical protein